MLGSVQRSARARSCEWGSFFFSQSCFVLSRFDECGYCCAVEHDKLVVGYPCVKVKLLSPFRWRAVASDATRWCTCL